MSTSNSAGLPDIEQLSDLANHLFKASPGEATGLPGMPQPLMMQGMHPAYQGYLTDAAGLQTAPPDPHIAAPMASPSVSGAGASPGAVQQIDFIDLNNFVNIGDGNSNTMPAIPNQNLSGNHLNHSSEIVS